MPSPSELDLFDAEQVRQALRDIDAVLHLASHIPTADRRRLPGAWDANDRLRDEATRLLVDGALSADTALIVVPTVAFVYPPGPADESTPLADVADRLRSALEAENHLRRFNDAGRRGVRVAPWFALWTGSRVAHAQRPLRRSPHTEDAGSALVAALSCPGGVYDVCDDTDPASHDRFTEATAGAHDRGDRQPSP
jgi:nucleoside-diphosphate-sugar epimerase